MVPLPTDEATRYVESGQAEFVDVDDEGRHVSRGAADVVEQVPRVEASPAIAEQPYPDAEPGVAHRIPEPTPEPTPTPTRKTSTRKRAANATKSTPTP